MTIILTLRWSSQAWASTKRQFLERAGHRPQQWSAPERYRATDDTPSSAMEPMSRLRYPSLGYSDPLSNITKASEQSTSVLPSLLAQQHAVVRAMSPIKSDNGNGLVCKSKPFLELCRAVDVPSENVIDENGLSRLDLICYQNILEMLSDMVGESRGDGEGPLPEGHFAALCFEDESGPNPLRRQLRGNTRAYLERQLWSDLVSVVDAAVKEGYAQLAPCGPEQSRVQRVRAYVSVLFANGLIGPSRHHVMSVSETTPQVQYSIAQLSVVCTV